MQRNAKQHGETCSTTRHCADSNAGIVDAFHSGDIAIEDIIQAGNSKRKKQNKNETKGETYRSIRPGENGASLNAFINENG